jgi:uncharacterized protein (DUF1499 family)
MPMETQRRTPALINWIGYLALTLLLLLPLAVLTVRSGAWQQGLGLYALACLGSTAVLALLVLLSMLPRYSEWRPQLLRRGLLALPGTLLLALLLSGRGDHPPIHDISTDVADPPQFTDAAVSRRGPGSNSLDYNPDNAEQQAAAYPDVQTLRTSISIEQSFELAQQVAAQLGWEVYHSDLAAGLIEAEATTPVMNFSDDVVIRLRTNADGTLIDLRSVSRVGVSDLGANAARIEAFIDAFPKPAVTP